MDGGGQVRERSKSAPSERTDPLRGLPRSKVGNNPHYTAQFDLVNCLQRKEVAR
jgi:hypothetical protein